MLIQKMNRQIIFGLVTVALLLTSCNVGATPAPTLDVNAINTAIVGTTIAQLSVQFTQTALAAPTNTPAPTNTAVSLPTFALPTTEGLPTTSGALPTVSFNTTPLPGFTQVASTVVPGATVALGDECNNNAFEGDVTIPDGTVMLPGEDFTKTWAIRNTGTCTWDDGYSLVFVAGDRALDPYNYKIKNKKDFIAPGEAVNISIDLTAPLEVGKYEAHFRMMNDKGYYFGTLLSVYIEVKKKK
ncbi:MAG: hypothetical protein HXY35_16535 [Chloroflexi bacterium]|nr:hypothetical protein [Chloroflexota bacterium]